MKKSEETKDYGVVMSKFLGADENGNYTYELTFNQSLVHTGRFKGIEDGLNEYRRQETKEYEDEILQIAEAINSDRKTK